MAGVRLFVFNGHEGEAGLDLFGGGFGLFVLFELALFEGTVRFFPWYFVPYVSLFVPIFAMG